LRVNAARTAASRRLRPHLHASARRCRPTPSNVVCVDAVRTGEPGAGSIRG
jgi:hypothetical protein